MFKHIVFSFCLVLAPLPAMAAMDAEPAPFSIARIQNAPEVANFELTETFLSKMEKVQAELVELPLETGAEGTGDDESIKGLTEAIEARPQLMGLLKKYDLKSRDYVVGYMALASSLAAASADGEDQFFDETRSVSPDNFTFAKKYADRIRTLLEN